MVEEEIIKNFTITLNYDKIGRHIPAFIFVNVEKTELKDKNYCYSNLAKKIKQLPEVENSCAVTGTFDILVKVRVEDVTKLNEFLERLREIKGIRKTQTAIILEEAN